MGKVQNHVVGQWTALLDLLDDHWRSTAYLAARTPWSVLTCGARLDALQTMGLIEVQVRKKQREWRKVKPRMGVVCPECGQRARLAVTPYGRRDDCCDLWSWRGKPLVDAETHRARRAAHEAFDGLWKSGAISRRGAYRELQRELGLSEAECHMSVMDAETAGRVPAAVAVIWPRVSPDRTWSDETLQRLVNGGVCTYPPMEEA